MINILFIFYVCFEFYFVKENDCLSLGGSTITIGTCDGHLNGLMEKKSIMGVTNLLFN